MAQPPTRTVWPLKNWVGKGRLTIRLLTFLSLGMVKKILRGFRTVTLPETNIAPENRPSQKETSILTIHFQVQAVSFREGKFFGGVH